jgi:mRNA interferase RelE/StbE
MQFKIVFHPAAAIEVSELENRQKSLVLKQIKKISKTPYLGNDLGNKNGLDLSGYRKMYADRKKIRIVYKILEKKILIQIIAIGKRDNMKVYKKAANRIHQ